MDGWLALLGAFPTVVFAGLSVLCLLYWLLVLVGAADIDGLDSLTGGVTGKTEGALDAVAAGVKGSTSAVSEALSALGLTQVPVTISLSLFSLTALLASATTRHLLDPLVPGAASAALAFVAAVVGGAVATAVVTRPLRGIFDDGRAEQGGDSLIGKTCRITISADDKGGQARVGEVIVRVRVKGGAIAAEEDAVILDRDADGVFVVEPLKALLPTQQDAFDRLEAQSQSAALVVEAAAKKS